ncbi:MAG: hypothetical protein DRI83_09740 [Bacteroidetes bacterium]|nr:MAG: hypothetical protein DRI83_09740 [Bacteroidota bacterium]
MKKSTIVLFVLLVAFPICGIAQVSDITKINDKLTERPWLDLHAYELYGYTITQVFGERRAIQSHSNLGSITTMAYLDQQQLLAGINTMDIPKEKKAELKEKYKNEAAGGAVQLFITRLTESRANFRWFFIVIRGEDDKEKIMEIDLEYQASQLPDANGWWNYTTVLLPKPMNFPFYVYVNDRQSQYLSDYKFKVSK